MEEIIISCYNMQEADVMLRMDIDYLRTTNIDFKVNMAGKEIIFPGLNKKVIYMSSRCCIDGKRNTIPSYNHSIKEILKGNDSNE